MSIELPGWTCAACHAFNGAMKEVLLFCRVCDMCRRCGGKGKTNERHLYVRESGDVASNLIEMSCGDCATQGKRPVF